MCCGDQIGGLGDHPPRSTRFEGAELGDHDHVRGVLQGVLDRDQRSQRSDGIRVNGVDDAQPVCPRQCFIDGWVMGAVQEGTGRIDTGGCPPAQHP